MRGTRLAIALAVVGCVGATAHAQSIVDVDPTGSFLTSSDLTSLDDPNAPTTVSFSDLNFSTKIPISQQYLAIRSIGNYTYQNAFPCCTPINQNSTMLAAFSSASGLIPPGSPVVSFPQTITNADFQLFHSTDLLGHPIGNSITPPSGATAIEFSPPPIFGSRIENNLPGTVPYRVQLYTLRDAFSTPLSVEVTDNGGIQAIWTPAVQVDAFTLPSLIGGYSHLNFLQVITDFTYNGEQRDSISPFGVLAGRPIGLDPLPGGNPGCIFCADQSPLYWDETRIFGRSDYFYGNNLDVGSATFTDLPNLLQKGWTAYFTTSLVGVRTDGTFDILSDLYDLPGLTFRWSYTQTQNFSSGSSEVFSNVDPALAGGGEVQFLGYGLADVVSSSVPEPSTWATLFLGFTFVCGAQRKKRSFTVAPTARQAR